MTGYRHKSIDKLMELHLAHKDAIVAKKGIGLAYRALAPQIPDFLTMLDEDEETYPDVKTFFITIAEAMKEDART